ncbi:hypothetical protein O181_067499 [Austropuccinia psidii MF-1]|uniref:Uncharacterized protein n=1 Tax=Austropuccinia psidii MF-1 TaxID=1389203 RepID=A0A9Q3I6L4_9BASI|nr:hypothetical protein [Austropuccinia psidii MF-1]
MLLTILKLTVPSRHASNAAYHPSARIVPSRNASNAAYHPYACIVPAQHASNAAYHPYARSALPTCLQCPPHTGLILTLLKPPQDATTMPPPISSLTTPYASAPPPFLLCRLQFLGSCGALKICLWGHPKPPLCLFLSEPLTIVTLRYGGFLAYMMNAIREIC